MLDFFGSAAALLATLASFSASGADLEHSFQNPPDSAKPLTWWHWIDGNITKSGITGDLEAMKRAGLGGCYLFNIGSYLPERPVSFMSPEWRELIQHSVNEAGRLGLVFGVHNCDGWGQSGGPWITPETSMKELTHSSRDVDGSAQFDETLPAPPSKQGFYRDIAVVGFRLPEGNRLNGPDSDTTVSGTTDLPNLSGLCDGRFKTRAVFPPTETGHQVQFHLAQAQPVRTITFNNVICPFWEEDFPVVVQTSRDGKTWTTSSTVSFSWDTAKGTKPVTTALGDLNTAFLRLCFTNPWPVEIGEIELSSVAKVHFAEAKAGWLRARGHGGEAPKFARYPGPDRHRILPDDLVVQSKEVVDLTAKLDSNGHLRWDIPPGRWRILRVGYTSNGRLIHPATSGGRGLECDKLDPDVVRTHLDSYVGKLVQQFGPDAGNVLKAVETDSWECDVQNWTAGFENRFKQRLGYDIVPWLPLLIEGWVENDSDASERMLWDWRRFLADQFAENYYAQVSRYLKARGLTYVSEGAGRQTYLYDPIGYQRHADKPMGEFWRDTGPAQGVRVDNKVAASVAHISGRRLVASESYTSSSPFAEWQNHPYSLKALGDQAYCAGVNQFVFHSFAHQPYEVIGPGFTMAYWGLNFNRANTWWEQGRDWVHYLTRCNFMLQEGRFVADVLWFIGEDVPNRVGWRDELNPALPPGYDFDACDAKTLFDATVKDGQIVLPSGMSYRVLLLPNRTTMRPPVLRRISELARAGAVILGAPPKQSPSLCDLGAGDATVRKIAQDLWGPCDGIKIKEHVAGKGRVYEGLTFPEVFERLNLGPDFAYRASTPDAEILYIHRIIDGDQVYFISNQKPRSELVSATFRVGALQPELWNPITGAITRPAVFKSTASGVQLDLSLDPVGSVFVVFRKPFSEPHVVSVKGGASEDVQLTDAGALAVRAWKAGKESLEFSNGTRSDFNVGLIHPPIEITGPWTVEFPPKLGAPASAVFDKLVSWPDRPEPGIRFFSGTATYRTEFDAAADLLIPGNEVYLDLGDVQVIAEVRLNGHDLGILWKPPFRANLSGALRAGKNQLEVRITNLWRNRMIGDEQLPDSLEWQAKRPLLNSWPDWLLNHQPRPDGRVTFCTRKVFKKDDPLVPSGLIGPVKLVCAKEEVFPPPR